MLLGNMAVRRFQFPQCVSPEFTRIANNFHEVRLRIFRALLNTRKMPSYRHDLSLLIVVLIWGLNFPILKAVLGSMDPHALNLFRLWMAALALGLVHLAHQRKAGRPFFAPLRTHFWKLLVLGMTGFFLYQVCFIEGLEKTTAGNAALIIATAPIWTGVIASTLRIEIIRPTEWLGIGATIAGAAIIIGGGSEIVGFSADMQRGNLILVLASICFGTYTTLCKPLSRSVNPSGMALMALLLALPLLTAVGLARIDSVDWDAITGWHWAAIAYSGCLSTGITIAIWNNSVRVVGAAHTSVYANLVPVIALILGAVLLHEPVSVVQLAGGGLILGGLYFVRRQRLRRTLPPAPLAP